MPIVVRNYGRYLVVGRRGERASWWWSDNPAAATPFDREFQARQWVAYNLGLRTAEYVDHAAAMLSALGKEG